MPATKGEYEHQTAEASKLATREVQLMIFPGVTPLENMVATFDSARKCVTLCCQDLTSPDVRRPLSFSAHTYAYEHPCVRTSYYLRLADSHVRSPGCLRVWRTSQIAFAVIRAHRRTGVQVRVLADAQCAAKRTSLIKRLQDANVPVVFTNGVEYTVRERALAPTALWLDGGGTVVVWHTLLDVHSCAYCT